MANEIVLGIRLTADGKGAVGEVRATREEVGKLSRATDESAASAARLNREQQNLSVTMNNLVRVAGGLVGITLGANLIGDTVRAADAMTNMDSRIRLVTHSAAELAAVRSGIIAIADATRQTIEGTGEIYYRLSKGAETLNLTQGQVLALTQTVNQAIALSGSASESAKAAIIQFGQALASGVLRGEELNSVMEQAPALAEAIAKGLGVTVGELRTLGMEGSLTVRQIIEALEKSAPEVARQFSQLTPTVGQAWTQMENSTAAYIGRANQATSATEALAGSIQFVAQNFDGFAGVLGVTAAVGLGGLIGKLAEATRASIAKSLATREAAAVAQQAAAIEATAALQTAQARMASAEASLAEAMQQRALMNQVMMYGPARAGVERQIAVATAERTAAVTAASLAESRLAAATVTSTVATVAGRTALTGARAVMAALGGPLGVIVTLLTAGAIAWMMFGTNAATAAEKASAAYRMVAEEAGRTGRAEKAVAETKRDEIQAQLQAEATLLNQGKGGSRERLAQLQADYREQSALVSQFAEREKNLAAQMRSPTASFMNDDKWDTKAQSKTRKLMELGAAFRDSAKDLDQGSQAYQDALKRYQDKSAEILADKGGDRAALAAGKKQARADARDFDGDMAERDKARLFVEDYIGNNRQTIERVQQERELLELRERDRTVIEATRRLEDQAAEARARAYRDIKDPQLYQETVDQINTALKTQSEELARATADVYDYSRSWEHGAKKAINDYLDTVGNMADKSSRMIGNAFKNMEDALVEFVRHGKLDFSSLADSIINDLIRIQIQQNVTKPLAEWMGSSGGNWLSSLFGSGGSSSQASMLNSQWSWIDEMGATVHHGGYGPGDVATRRYVHPAYFESAPRYHTGIGPGERAAIITDDESVLTPGQMGQLAPVSAMGMQNLNVQVELVNNSSTPLQAVSAQPTFDLRGAVVRVVLEDVRSGGPIRSAVKNLMRPGM